MIVTNFLRPTLNRTYLHKFLITIIKRTTTQTVPEHNYQTIRQCYSWVNNLDWTPEQNYLIKARQFLRILQVDPDCRDETVIRKAYLEKVKEYHPDSTFQQSKADLDKFNDVQQAYETLIVRGFVSKTYRSDETLKISICSQGRAQNISKWGHTNTHNRKWRIIESRYSSHSSATSNTFRVWWLWVSSFSFRRAFVYMRRNIIENFVWTRVGTPSQRQNAYYKMRAEKAQERVYEYRKDRESIETRQELVERKKRGDIKST